MIWTTITFFTYDLVAEIIMGTADMLVSIHHASVITMGLFAYASSYCSNEALMVLWIGEVSNPFLEIRLMLKYSEYKDSTIAFINELVFVSVYLIARLILMPYFVLKFVSLGEYCPFTHKISLLALVLVSKGWNIQIL